MEIVYVLVRSVITHEMEVMNEILKTDYVKEAKWTFGVYDIFVKIEANSSKDIENVIAKIRKISNVASTITLSVIPEQNGK